MVNTQLTEELPLNGRNFVQLATLSPGVNGTGYSVGGTIMSGTRPDDRRPGTEIFSNGNREGSNDFLYDGIDDNDRLTLSIVLRPGVEAIKEFKVQTNLYSADQGRNSGAVVDVVTKSGTNEWHGSAFEFLRNSAMDARQFFNPVGTPFPSFKYNQFGGSFGGPIEVPKLYNGKNKTFFFVDYEGFRRTSQNLAIFTVPTAAMRQGNFSALQARENLRSHDHDPNRIFVHAHSVSRQYDSGQPLRSCDHEDGQRVSAAADHRAREQLHQQHDANAELGSGRHPGGSPDYSERFRSSRAIRSSIPTRSFHRLIRQPPFPEYRVRCL